MHGTEKIFRPGLTSIMPDDNCPLEATAHDIEQAPMLFSASAQYAWREGGDLLQTIMSVVSIHPTEVDRDVIIDTRSHMLMPGWYPAIPGWHLDDCPRPAGNQPDVWSTALADKKHITCVIDAYAQPTGAMTQFLSAPFMLRSRELPDADMPLYGRVDHLLNHSRITTTGECVETLKSGICYSFTGDDWHRAMPAKTRGWRYFFRASFDSPRKIYNKIRAQTQVYLPLGEGW